MPVLLQMPGVGRPCRSNTLRQWRLIALACAMGLLAFPGDAYAQFTDGCGDNVFGDRAAAPCATAGSPGSSNVIGTLAGVGMTGLNNNVIGTSAGNGLTGSNSNVMGYMAGNGMTGSGSTAIGYQAGQGLTGSTSTIIGYQAGKGMTGSSSTAIGYMAGNGMTSLRSSAIGYMAGIGMTALDSSATGYMAGQQMTGIGVNVIGNMAGQGMTGSNSSVIGNMAGVGMTGSDSSVMGYLSATGMTGSGNNVIGNSAGTLMTGSSNSVIGNGAGSHMTGSFNVAVGNNAGTVNSVSAPTSKAVAIGEGAVASISGAVALGAGSTAGAANTGQAGYLFNGVVSQNNVTATSVVGVGQRQITGIADGAITATSTDAVTGSQLFATDQAVNAIVTGTNMVIYNDPSHSAVSLGGVGAVVPVALGNVASGSLAAASTDAVNGSQLFATNSHLTTLGNTVSATFGGVSSYLNGTFSPPGYAIQGSIYTNVGSALAAIDFSLTNLSGQNGARPAGTAGPAGSNGTNGANGSPGTGSNSVNYDQAGQTSVTLGGAGSTTPVKLGNLAAGVSPSDAVNVEQMNTQTASAVQTANSYTNTSSRQTLATANNYTDQSIAGLKSQLNDQFSRVDTRISRTCAMGTAMTQMAMAGAGAGGGGRIAAGVGLCTGGASALSAGYATPLGDRAHFNFGAAVSAGTGTVGAGVGYDLQ